MQKIITILLCMLVLFPVVMAADTATSFKTSISPESFDLPNLDEKAEFRLEIENLATEAKHFKISQINPQWIVRTEPISYWTTGIEIPARSSKFINLYVQPTSSISTGIYKIELEIKPKDEKVMKKQAIIISIPDPSSRVYQPSIETIVDVPKTVDPREPLNINVTLKNKNPLNILADELKVIVKSESTGLEEPLLREETLTHLKPVGESGSEIKLTFTKLLDERMTPMEDTVRVTIFYKGEIVEPTPKAKTFNIEGYSEIISENKTDEKFLRESIIYTYANDGNIRNSETIKIRTSWFKSRFTKVSDNVELLKDEEGYYYTYSFSLLPDTIETAEFSTNYIPLAVVIAIILLSILSYYVFRSPILVHKDIRDVRMTSDGMAEAKIQIHIKNRSAMTLEEVRISDKVPQIAKLEKVFAAGTLEPSKIAEHEKSGTLIKWEIDEIERFEERLIVYKVRTRLAVVGGFKLPPFSVRFKTPRGEIRRKTSKPLNVKV